MAEESAYITHVWVDGFVKKFENNVYAIETTWSDARKYEIYRRYADFFSFQMFPIEAGKIDPNDRCIPSLPTIDNVLKLFGRTNSEAVMQSRLKTINHYCQVVLLKLEPKISKSKFVLSFFRPVPGDKQLKMLSRPASLHPQKIPAGSMFEEYIILADFKAEEGHEGKQLSVRAGETVLVLSRDATGWCLVNQVSSKKVGWVPEGFLKKPEENLSDYLYDSEQELKDSETQSDTVDIAETENSSILYHAIAEYSTDDLSQISFPEGAKILVIDQDEDGWWFASYDGREGWVPSSFLEPDDASMAVHLEEMDEVHVQIAVQPPAGEGDEDNKVPGIAEQEDSAANSTVYYTKVDYVAYWEDEISFPKGVAVEVMNKSVVGWWTIRYNDQVGLAPATLLSETPPGSDVEHSSLQSRPPPPRRKTVRRTLSRRHKVVRKAPTVVTSTDEDSTDSDGVAQTASSPFLRQRKKFSPQNPPIKESSPPASQNLALTENTELNDNGEFKFRRQSAVRSKSYNGRFDMHSNTDSSSSESTHGYRRRAEDLEHGNEDEIRHRAKERARSRSPSPLPGSRPSSPFPAAGSGSSSPLPGGRMLSAIGVS